MQPGIYPRKSKKNRLSCLPEILYWFVVVTILAGLGYWAANVKPSSTTYTQVNQLTIHNNEYVEISGVTHIAIGITVKSNLGKVWPTFMGESTCDEFFCRYDADVDPNKMYKLDVDVSSYELAVTPETNEKFKIVVYDIDSVETERTYPLLLAVLVLIISLFVYSTVFSKNEENKIDDEKVVDEDEAIIIYDDDLHN